MKTRHYLTTVLLLLMVSACTNEDKENYPDENNTTISKIIEENYKGWVTVGKLENNRPVFTVNKENLIKSLNENLFLLTGEISKIDKVSFEKFEKINYLVFSGNNVKVTFYVQKSKGSNNLMAAGKTACRTVDCSQEQLGCVVKYPNNLPGQDGIGYCTPCGNGGVCEKINSGDDDPIIQP